MGCFSECPSIFLDPERLGVWLPLSDMGEVPDAHGVWTSSFMEAVSSRTKVRGEEELWEDTHTGTGDSVRLFEGVKDSGIFKLFRLKTSSFTGARGAIAMSAPVRVKNGS